MKYQQNVPTNKNQPKCLPAIFASRMGHKMALVVRAGEIRWPIIITDVRSHCGRGKANRKPGRLFKTAANNALSPFRTTAEARSSSHFHWKAFVLFFQFSWTTPTPFPRGWPELNCRWASADMQSVRWHRFHSVETGWKEVVLCYLFTDPVDNAPTLGIDFSRRFWGWIGPKLFRASGGNRFFFSNG